MTPISAIVTATAKCANMKVAEITGRDRRKQIVWARQCGYVAARRATDASFPDIGWAFGRRDHTTILDGVHRIIERGNEFHEAMIRAIIARAAEMQTKPRFLVKPKLGMINHITRGA